MDPRYDRVKLTRTKVEKDKINWIEQIGCGKTMMLDEYLKSQLHLKLNKDEQKVIEHLIESLDENGYLRADLQTAARTLQMPLENVEQMLEELQELEPAGIGARNLQECLSLQIKRLPERNELAEIIIDDYFTFLRKRNGRRLPSSSVWS